MFVKTLFAALALLAATNAAAASAQEPSNLSETYDTWMVQCRPTGDAGRRLCQMSQELLQKETRQRVIFVALTRFPDGPDKVTVVTPFGMRLSDGLSIEVEGKPLLTGGFKTCLSIGCVVEIDLGKGVVEKLSVAEKAVVAGTADDGQPVRTDISLRGFTNASKRLSALSAP